MKKKVIRKRFLFVAAFTLFFLTVTLILASLFLKELDEMTGGIQTKLRLIRLFCQMAIFSFLSMALLVVTLLVIYRKSENETGMHILKLNALMARNQTKNEELNREVESHKETSRELLEYKEHLQALVDKQTRELLKANESLRKSMKNLKATQNQLVISEKLASLGSLVAGVAHEINTPLGSAVTGITWIHDRTKEVSRLYDEGDLSAEEFHEFLTASDEICRSITLSLSNAVRLVLSFKQVSVDQTTNEMRAFRVREYLDEIILSLRNILKKTDITIVIECDPTLLVESHPGFLSQIITNLIQNSIIHGYPEEKTGIIRISARLEGKNLHLIYSDNGVGIPKEHRSRIFDPFFTTARGKGGTGLGLHIVYTLVTDNLRGNIKLVDAGFPGTCFELRIPVSTGGGLTTG
jgi:signal transduction histidine kinase